MPRRTQRIRCLHRVGRRGLAGACIEGVLSSSAQIVVIMDGDLQHDEAILPQMIALLRQGGIDLVIGSRRSEDADAGFSPKRATASQFATWLAQRALPFAVTDPMSGFFAIRRRPFDALAPRLTTDGFKLLLDILSTGGASLRTAEVHYTFRAREDGMSKFDLRSIFDFLGLLMHKMSGGVIPYRFLLFAAVGATGVVIHLGTLKLGLSLGRLTFPVAQAGATCSAMASNFFVNNLLTYRDMQLRGRAALVGLIKFAAVCSIGAFANIGLANWLYDLAEPWWLAGSAGVVVGSVFNYSMSSAFVWRRARGTTGAKPLPDAVISAST